MHRKNLFVHVLISRKTTHSRLLLPVMPRILFEIQTFLERTFLAQARTVNLRRVRNLFPLARIERKQERG
jgi:hypothetical protein